MHVYVLDPWTVGRLGFKYLSDVGARTSTLIPCYSMRGPLVCTSATRERIFMPSCENSRVRAMLRA